MARKRDQRMELPEHVKEASLDEVLAETVAGEMAVAAPEPSAPAPVAEQAPVVQTAAVPADRRVAVQVGRNGDAYFLSFDRDIGRLELTRMEALTIAAALFAELVSAVIRPPAVP